MSIRMMALAAAIAGIVAIIVLSSHLEPRLIKTSNIDDGMIGQYVKVSGDVSKIKHSKITSFTIKDDSDQSGIYAFSYENLNLTEGSYELVGKVNDYHGALEIEIGKIRRMM